MFKINLNNNDLQLLNESLHYLKMIELKHLCKRYNLSTEGNKVVLIERIVKFFQTGEEATAPEIPFQSKAQKGKIYPITAHGLMLHGAYKNDLKTREFFKKLIGNYFHFTAFGIDWLNERWLAGNPPTYAEFAEYWKKEYASRQSKKPAPKKEWAYINFTQRILKQHPTASRHEINEAWELERLIYVNIVKKILRL